MPEEVKLSQFKFLWPFPDKKNWSYEIKSKVMLTLVFTLTKIMFSVFNTMKVENKGAFIKLLEDKSRPLISVANHQCNIDDPLFWSMLTFREFFRNINRMRYTLTAHNICFTTQRHTDLFSLGRCVPCVRGEGIFQRGMDECVTALNRNDWVHMFPQGKVIDQNIRIKWGISRLITESKVPPVLLPMWFDGMWKVWPRTPPYYPLWGKTVRIVVGEPVDLTQLISDTVRMPELERRKRIADFVQKRFYELGERVEVGSQ